MIRGAARVQACRIFRWFSAQDFNLDWYFASFQTHLLRTKEITYHLNSGSSHFRLDLVVAVIECKSWTTQCQQWQRKQNTNENEA